MVLLLCATGVMLWLGEPRLGDLTGWPVRVGSLGLCVVLCGGFLAERLWLQDHPEHWGGVSATSIVVFVGLIANLGFAALSFVSADSPAWHAAPLIVYGIGGVLVGGLGDYPAGDDDFPTWWLQ
ncbi:hypothetical protein ACO229_10210 [Promicromonospora sp. MS192]|uniref:hypothetical protein n=1 Tax=Promicromonospora sp. MS192 TaxID=3412684 RepID=UPI003C2E4DFC